jgi:thioredoxin-like negative regulator of GroEL
MVHGLEDAYWGQVDFVYIDREALANQSVTQQFGVRAQPVLVLLDANGDELQRWFGSVTEADLRAALDGVAG